MTILQVMDIEPSIIVHLWNETLEDKFPMTKNLWIQNTVNDSNVLNQASIAYVEGNELLGFVVSKHYQEHNEASMASHIGWVQCLLVKESARNRGIGTQLLRHVEEAFHAAKITNIHLGRDPWHYFPGIPLEDKRTIEWFEKQGYSKVSIETDLTKVVKDQPLYTLTNSSEYFRVLTNADLPKLLQFLEQSFPGRWHYEAIHYIIHNGTGRDFMGFFLDNELQGFCRINDSQSPVIGQNVYWSELFEGELGGIGPLGINRSIRGKHYGLDLVKAAANELISRNMSHIVIDWTQLNSFYEKLGFTTWKQYQTMAKIISN